MVFIVVGLVGVARSGDRAALFYPGNPRADFQPCPGLSREIGCGRVAAQFVLLFSLVELGLRAVREAEPPFLRTKSQPVSGRIKGEGDFQAESLTEPPATAGGSDLSPNNPDPTGEFSRHPPASHQPYAKVSLLIRCLRPLNTHNLPRPEPTLWRPIASNQDKFYQSG